MVESDEEKVVSAPSRATTGRAKKPIKYTFDDEDSDQNTDCACVNVILTLSRN